MKAHRKVFAPWHPKASSSGMVYEHVLIAEDALGHVIPDGSQIHHVDGDYRNNANTNLVICQDVAFHKLLHHRTKVIRAGGDPNTQKFCRDCSAVRSLADFNVMRANKSTGRQSVCRSCQRIREHHGRAA